MPIKAQPAMSDNPAARLYARARAALDARIAEQAAAAAAEAEQARQERLACWRAFLTTHDLEPDAWTLTEDGEYAIAGAIRMERAANRVYGSLLCVEGCGRALAYFRPVAALADLGALLADYADGDRPALCADCAAMHTEVA
jgi:hypothetical protein